MRMLCAKMVPKNLTTELKANRRNVCVLIFWPALRGNRILQSRYHRWWIMFFGIRPRDKTSESGVAHCNLSPSQESENEQIQIQIDSHLFFWQSGDRPQGICATRTNCQSNILSENFWKTQEKGGTCATRHCTDTWMLHHDNAPCHTAVSINEFLAEKSIPMVPQPPYLPDLSPCDFFYSSGSKTTWESAILVLWIISRRA